MSKKFGKFILFSAVAGAAAYSTYYYLQKKDKMPASPVEEDIDDDFDDFSEDLDEEIPPVKDRTYVSLSLDKAEAIAHEAFHKAKEVIADSVQQVKDTVKSVKESQAGAESNFTDLTALNKEHAASFKAEDEPSCSEQTPVNPDSEEAESDAAVNDDTTAKESSGGQSVGGEDTLQHNTGEQLTQSPLEASDAAFSPESCEENLTAGSDTFTQADEKKTEIKETANGQVEDFFDDTP